MKYHSPRRTIIKRIDEIITDQLGQISAAIIEAKVSILAAVACMNLIEFLGGLYSGELCIKGKVESRFKHGVRLLGAEYMDFGEDRMYALRNSLTHEYMPSVEQFEEIWIINDWGADEPWPPYRQLGNTFKQDAIMVEEDILWLNVNQLYDDIGNAWQFFKKELERNDTLVGKAEEALERLPKLTAQIF